MTSAQGFGVAQADFQKTQQIIGFVAIGRRCNNTDASIPLHFACGETGVEGIWATRRPQQGTVGLLAPSLKGSKFAGRLAAITFNALLAESLPRLPVMTMMGSSRPGPSKHIPFC